MTQLRNDVITVTKKRYRNYVITFRLITRLKRNARCPLKNIILSYQIIDLKFVNPNLSIQVF